MSPSVNVEATEHQTKQLTSKSASDLQQGVNISDIGQTFQDVIMAARYLDLRYIWINSFVGRAVNVNAPTKLQHKAAMQGSLASAQLLVAQETEVYTLDGDGNKPVEGDISANDVYV
ncbi:hypothetical protein B0I35DRAFT_465301 [Stachybotrys elegans]|uniref:Uncharacterized protein n=1 Tax=Stachybotrys elegans TaxID=80388 RepID=A0A8K0SCH4_9HYPO|nr:hypothetical protein B0I35DRAFT_465301 [Stachybotrys elegans]